MDERFQYHKLFPYCVNCQMFYFFNVIFLVIFFRLGKGVINHLNSLVPIWNIHFRSNVFIPPQMLSHTHLLCPKTGLVCVSWSHNFLTRNSILHCFHKSLIARAHPKLVIICSYQLKPSFSFFVYVYIEQMLHVSRGWFKIEADFSLSSLWSSQMMSRKTLWNLRGFTSWSTRLDVFVRNSSKWMTAKDMAHKVAGGEYCLSGIDWCLLWEYS